MTKGFRFLIAFAVVWAARGQQQGGAFDPARHVSICLGENTDVRVRWALDKQESIFAPMGINVAWFANGACPLRTDSIRLDFRTVPSDFRPGALAYAYPFGAAPHVFILLDRVEKLARENYRGIMADMLAYVIAHEIAHVLEETNAHSESGIMKAVWGGHEYAEMRLHKLTWEDQDIDMVHSGMARRAALAAQNRPKETVNR